MIFPMTDATCLAAILSGKANTSLIATSVLLSSRSDAVTVIDFESRMKPKYDLDCKIESRVS